MAANLQLKYCANLIQFLKNIINSENFKHRCRVSPKAFTRNRILNFTSLILLLINLRTSSIRTEMAHFFKTWDDSDIPMDKATSSAFSQARLKLKPEAFIELNGHMVRYFYNHAEVKTWFGYNLMAIDGSKLRLPNKKDIPVHFGMMYPKNGDPLPMARISQMFDVLNKITIDAIISPMAVGEHELASQHVLHLRPTDLVLMDRGYPAFWLFKMILAVQSGFCARISDKKWLQVKKFRESAELEQIIDLTPTFGSKKTCRELGLDIEPIRLRLIRVELESGETEILITSLTDSESFPHHLFQELYHRRWPVEEDYKVMKNRLEIENWSGESVVSVEQDFYAKVFVKNLAAALVHPLKPIITAATAHRKHDYQINFSQVLSKIKNTVVLLFKRSDLKRLLSDFIDVLARLTEPIRTNRKNKRIKKIYGRRFYSTYKAIS